MAAKEFSKNTILYQPGQPLEGLHIIVNGQVRASFPGGELLLGRGDVIGLCDIYCGVYSFTYETADTVQIGSYPFRQISDLEALLKLPEVSRFLLMSSAKQTAAVFDIFTSMRERAVFLSERIKRQYGGYKVLCARFEAPVKALSDLEAAEDFSLEDEPDAYLAPYYADFQASASVKAAFLSSLPLMKGFLLQSSRDLYAALEACQAIEEYCENSSRFLLNEEFSDLFDLYITLQLFLKKHGLNDEEATACIDALLEQIEHCSYISKELYSKRLGDYKRRLLLLAASSESQNSSPSDLTGSLDAILSYSGLDLRACNEFRQLIASYKKLLDKNSADDQSRQLRLAITKAFYPLYTAVFKKSLTDSDLSALIQMFLNFGYVDEELAGQENAIYLYSLTEQLKDRPDRQLYTYYQWLLAIYNREKEPSRNEFDNDYPSHLRELRNAGKLSETDEARLLNDPMARVTFELESVFPMVNKITFGRISTFCPVFSEHNIFKGLEQALVTKEIVNETFRFIRDIDYSVFYRDSVFSNAKCNIARETVQVEILPDVILMPGIGSRGIMWQEIEGRKRTTPARMMLSMFYMEDIKNALIRLAGEYRWEMCKRVQGVRWNDVSDRSLTSEYCDYAQFFRKNIDLSPDAKEKVKTALQKAKNNYKEMFVNDYLIWILFEGNGTPRLNKVARSILFMHCPFSEAVRSRLAANPLYKDMLEAYNVRTGQKLHHLETVLQRFRSNGVEIPPELAAQKAFLEA